MTTVDQATGTFAGDEPLDSLAEFRYGLADTGHCSRHGRTSSTGLLSEILAVKVLGSTQIVMVGWRQGAYGRNTAGDLNSQFVNTRQAASLYV